MNLKNILIFFLFLSVFSSGAQNLTATYVELADSADYYISKKMWPEAERVIIKALKHEPANKSNYLLWSNLGIVRENQENYAGAAEAFTIGLSSAPSSTVLLTNRARAYLALNDLPEALNDLENALELDNTLQWPLKMKGLLLVATEKYDKAKETLKQYMEKYGNDASVTEALGDIFGRECNFEEAIKSYKEAYNITSDVDLLNKMLLTAYSAGRIDEMAQDISDGIKAFPHNGTLYLIRALLNKSRFQTNAYESDLKTALNLGVNKDLFNYLTGK